MNLPVLPIKRKLCSSCRRPFDAIRGEKNGRWPSTCSPRCRLAALDRLLERIQTTRQELAASLDRWEGA